MLIDSRGLLISPKTISEPSDQDPFTYRTLDTAPLDSPYWEILIAVTEYEIALTLLSEPEHNQENNPQKRAALIQSMNRSLDRLGCLLDKAQDLQ